MRKGEVGKVTGSTQPDRGGVGALGGWVAVMLTGVAVARWMHARK